MPNANISRTWTDGGLATLPPRSSAKVFLLPDRIEIVTSRPHNSGAVALAKTKRQSGTHYVDMETGELLPYGQREISERMRERFKKLRLLIINNFSNFDSFHITLTYAVVVDYETAIADFKRFHARLVYKYSEYEIEYLRIIEPNDEGQGWHFHVILKSSVEGRRFRPNKAEVESIWGLGSVERKQVYNVVKLANYFNTKKKRKRWEFYPDYKDVFTKSKGVKHPEVLRMMREEVEEYLAGYILDSCACVKVEDEESGQLLNMVNFETFVKNYHI